MAMAVKWLVDENLTVEIDGDNILVKQGQDTILMDPSDASAAELVDALLAAISESGRDMPDLSRHTTPGPWEVGE